MVVADPKQKARAALRKAQAELERAQHQRERASAARRESLERVRVGSVTLH
jgi:hypothetical protein